MGGLGRLCGAGGAISRSLGVVLVVLWLGAAAAFAQEPALRCTIVVFGDSQAQGLSLGLQRVLVEDPRYRVINRTHPGAAADLSAPVLGPALPAAGRATIGATHEELRLPTP